MMRRLLFFTLSIAALLAACSDNDTFSSSAGNRLTFSADTVRFDTLFSTIPSVTETFWVHNESGDGIRIQTVRLERGNQSGYRVNVDGTYLDPVGNDFEVRKGDSILVFVEVTTRENKAAEPQLVEDNLLFTLESGLVQRVNLRTYSWDAQKLSDFVVRHDTLIESSIPLLVSGAGIVVEDGATLTLRNTKLYFHDGAGVSVDGRLDANGCEFRGDRLDRMFDYLPYDRISGQWQGLSFSASSHDNVIANCDIHSAMDAVRCDSTQLTLTNTVIHNNRGYGLLAHDSQVLVSGCQFSNSMGDCLSLEGCEAVVDHCTLAQFYPFSANRGAAFRFTNTKSPLLLQCVNTLATGYEDDVVMGEVQDTTVVFDYYFADCLLRTPAVKDSTRFERIIWETPDDSIQGKKHFRTVDEDNLYYDFRLDSISPAFPLGIGRIEP